MELLEIDRPEEKGVRKFVCESCGYDVVQKELVIPFGKYKGEITKANYGCRCEDIELGKQAVRKRDELKRNSMQRFFDENSLVNRSLQRATLDNYEPTSDELAKAKQQVTDYINNFDGTSNLLLYGSYGTGKSHLSISATKKVIEAGYSSLFLSLPKLLTKIRDTYNDDQMTEDRLLEHIREVDLLVLDDLGAEQVTEWSNSKLFEVMDSRSGKATIYTTNLGSAELRDHMNERNFSRLMEDTEIVIMNGADYRRRSF